jgi:hypothetical protein
MRDGWRRVIGVVALVLLVIPLIGVAGIIFRVFRFNPLLWGALVGITLALGQYGAFRFDKAAARARTSTYVGTAAWYQAAQRYRAGTGQAGTTRARSEAGYGEPAASEDDEGQATS